MNVSMPRAEPRCFLVVSKEDGSAGLIDRIAGRINCHLSDRGIRYDGLIVLGGDGTVLKALSHSRNPPVVYAVNCGRVGFLCPISYSEVDELVDRLSRGEDTKFFEARRLCLSPDTYFLNEAVLRLSSNKLGTFRIHVDDVSLVVRADGVMVSTKTGSSGYNISINGPVLLSENIVVNALAPNKCGFRPIVCCISSRIRVETDDEDAVVVVDGVSMEGRTLEVLYDGSVVRFGYLGKHDESTRLRKLLLLE